MFSLQVKLDVDKYRQALEAAPEVLEKHFGRASVIATAGLEARVKELIAARYGEKPAAVAFGTLVNSVFGEPRTDHPVFGGVVSVSPPADVYAAPVETGARAHFPPPQALYAWVKKKFGTTDEAEIKSIAFVIARSISRKGTKGHRMFQRGIEEMGPEIIKGYEDALDAALDEIFSGGGGA